MYVPTEREKPTYEPAYMNLDSPRCDNCQKRFTESCPMRYSIRIGSYNTSIMSVDNTIDNGFCDRFKMKMEE